MVNSLVRNGKLASARLMPRAKEESRVIIIIIMYSRKGLWEWDMRETLHSSFVNVKVMFSRFNSGWSAYES